MEIKYNKGDDKQKFLRDIAEDLSRNGFKNTGWTYTATGYQEIESNFKYYRIHCKFNNLPIALRLADNGSYIYVESNVWPWNKFKNYLEYVGFYSEASLLAKSLWNLFSMYIILKDLVLKEISKEALRKL